MSNVLRELTSLLSLEKIEENLYRGNSQDLGWGRVYGGQVLGQALAAASATVPTDRHVHSLHAYFLLAGDVSKPIVYDVDRIRDGSSFTTRRVRAIQSGRAILNLAASFHRIEDGFDHQDEMPDVPGPDELVDDRVRWQEAGARLPSFIREHFASEGPFLLRTVGELGDPVAPAPREARRQYWFRTADALPDDPLVHRCLLAYVSDTNLVVTSLQPHGVTWVSPGMQVASLDHAMWFHRPFRADEWLLYAQDSPSAQSGRGLTRGLIFKPDGTLVASVAQEGSVRERK